MCFLLLNVDIRQTLLFGAPLWGAVHLFTEPVKHPLQPVYNVLMRQALGVPSSTANWITCLMSGQMPLQHWIVRDFYRFWNRLNQVAPKIALLQGCVFVQATLALARKECWLHKWVTALQRLLPCRPNILQDITALTQIQVDGVAGVMHVLQHMYDSLLHSYGDPFMLADVPHRKIALHYRCMWTARWGKRPWWHWCDDVPDAVMRSWTTFLTAWADIPAQCSVRDMHYTQRICAKCDFGVVGNEKHVALFCSATAGVRHRFRNQLTWPVPLDLCAFLAANRHRHCMFFIHSVMMAYSRSAAVHVS